MMYVFGGFFMLFVGATLGFFTAALMAAAKDDE